MSYSEPSGSLRASKPLTFLLFSLFYPLIASQLYNANVTGTISVDRGSSGVCQPVELKITLSFDSDLLSGQSIYIDLPGFTNGPCSQPKNGRNFHPVGYFNTSALSMLYYEGKYSQMFRDSQLRIYIEGGSPLIEQTEVEIVIDKSQGFKFQCMHETQFEVSLREIGTHIYHANGNLTFTSFTPEYCFAYHSSLSFFPPAPQQHLELTLTFRLAMDFKYGDNITVLLPGLTNTASMNESYSSLSERSWGRDDSLEGQITTLVDLDASTGVHEGITWHGRWIEGSYDPDLYFDRMYNGSYLHLWIGDSIGRHGDYTDKFIKAGNVFSIVIGRKNKLSTYCAVPANYSAFQLWFTSRNTSLTIPRASFEQTRAIGLGCPSFVNQTRKLEVCGGRGTCNLCTQQCECFDGFGSVSDRNSVEADTFPRDCSGKICPFGTSFASLIQPSDSDSFQHGHKQTECSSSGLCDRSRGVCTCFPGFSGAACQRRGRCYDMSMLSSIYEAFPLRATASNERYFYEAAVDSSTWDGDLSMGCVCDSGWRVGLGNGETQLAEFFGPACEFRRCPSGDDPTTPNVNETDCSGKSQVTGILSGVGEDGNLCHYECSGRGKCDYQTGVCKCYPGVEGPNCGRLVNPARDPATHLLHTSLFPPTEKYWLAFASVAGCLQNFGSRPDSTHMSNFYNQPGQNANRQQGPPGGNFGPPSSQYGPPGSAPPGAMLNQPNSNFPAAQYGPPGSTPQYAAPGGYAAPPGQSFAPPGQNFPPPNSQGPPSYGQPSGYAAPPSHNIAPQFGPPPGGNFQGGPPSSGPPSGGGMGVRPPPKSNVQFFSVGGGNAAPVPAPAAPFGAMPPPPPSSGGPPTYSSPPPSMPGPPTLSAAPGDAQHPPSPGGQHFQGYAPPSGQGQFNAPPGQGQFSQPGTPGFGFQNDPNGFGAPQNNMAGMPIGFDSGTYGQPQQPGGAMDPNGPNTPQILPGIEEMDLSIQCDPSFLRASVGKIVNSQALASQSRVPLGIVCRPMAGDVGTDNDLVEVVDFGSTGIVRCKRCRTYINPFVSWVDNGRRWRCNICGMLNDVPTSYFSHLDQGGQRRDKDQRPELSRCSVEFVAPGDYMVRPPQPPVFFFVIDVTSSASSSGMLRSCVNAIKRSLDELPGNPRTQVGFITFDSSIHFYNLKSSLKAPQMLVVSDITDVIMPSPEDLLVNLSESRDIVESLLDSLVSMFQNSTQLNSCTGPALMAAKRVIQNVGGKLVLCQTALPTLGEGLLKQRENPRLLGTDKEHHLLNPEDLWYKNNAIEFSRLQICVDVFLFSNQYTDVATFSALAKYTSGNTFYYPGFFGPRDGEKFETEMHQTLTRATAFEAVMRVRATKGLRISNFYGNFFIGGTDLLALPNCTSESVYAMDLSYDDPTLNASAITVQAALLYTNSNGERRIRIHTMVIPVTQSLPEMLASTDIDCAVNITAKQAVEISLKSGLDNSRQRIHQNCVEILRGARTGSQQQQPGFGPGYQQRPDQSQQPPPPSLQLLPLYSMSLQKNLALRGGADVRTDERAFFQNLLLNMDIEESKVFIYPRMFSIHDMPLDAGTPVDNAEDIPTAGLARIRLPAILNLSHERLTSEGLFLLENGYDLFLWIGRNVSPAILDTLFGVSSLEGIDLSQLHIHPDNSDFSYRVNSIILALRSERSRYLQLHFIKEGDGYAEAFFSRFLVEDRANFTGGTFSYVEYYSFVSRQVSGLPG